MSKGHKILKIVIICLASIWAVVTIALQVVLNSKVLTSIVNRYAAQYVDGTLKFDKITASMFKSFPNLNVILENFTLTYPHERYAGFDTLGVYGQLLGEGRSQQQDTLASFRKMSVSVDYVSAIFGTLRIRRADLDHPRIFAHYYDSTAANWDIFKISSDTTKTDTSSSMMPIVVKRVSLAERPLVVFTDQADTVYGLMTMKRLLFDGKFDSRDFSENKLGLDLDSLLVAGRLPEDTLALGIDHFRVKQKAEHTDFDAKIKAFLALKSAGRMQIPVDFSGQVSFPQTPKLKKAILREMPRKDRVQERELISGAHGKSISIRDFVLKVATVELKAQGDAIIGQDSTFIKADASIDRCSIKELLDYFKGNFPVLEKFKTNADLNLAAHCNGYYNSSRGSLPALSALLSIPKSNIEYTDFDKKGIIRLNATALTNSLGRLNVDADDIFLDATGLHLKASATAEDLTGKDPLYGIDGCFSAKVDTLLQMLPSDLGIKGRGDIDLDLKGKIRQSQMDMYSFSKADLDGILTMDGVQIDDEADSIYTDFNHAEARASSMANKADNSLSKGARVLGLLAKIDSIYFSYKDSTFVNANGLGLSAQNSSEILNSKLNEKFFPLLVHLKGDNISMMTADSALVSIHGNKEFFRIIAGQGRNSVPTLTLTSDNDLVTLQQTVNRMTLGNLHLDATAAMNTVRDRRMRNHFLDSLARVYPGVPRDSLFEKMMRNRMAGRPLPSFLSEKDFEKNDIHIQVSESLAKYIREWNLKGNVSLKDGLLITPYFPLRNKLYDVRGKFTSDEVDLQNITLRSGESDISATGTLKGLKRTMLGRGLLFLDMKVTSNYINGNELLTAYSAGSKYVAPHSGVASLDEMSDAEYQKQIVSQAAEPDTASTLIVVPANVIANISLEASHLTYNDLDISWMASDMAMRERCLQLTNTLATSNMGDLYFEGFYSTKTKKDLSAGFDLSMVDITADKVIQLFPDVDSIIPMLKSFKGSLDCEMAATSDLDTAMNFITPTVNGVMRIAGKNLSLEQSDEFYKIAKTLMFRDKNSGHIDQMTVDGLISDNKLEVFPFVLKVDRYTLALSGIQSLDQSFKYHISVIRSPIPFRFGINVYGKDFDHWKYRLGHAKYKNTNVPVFTQQIDTVERNLVSDIHNIFERGVDQAMKDNVKSQNVITKHKDAVGYSAEVPTDTLSRSEMDSLNRVMADSVETNPGDPMIPEKIDSRITTLQDKVKKADTSSTPRAKARRTKSEADKPKEK